jgi:hypothetical protein
VSESLRRNEKARPRASLIADVWSVFGFSPCIM